MTTRGPMAGPDALVAPSMHEPREYVTVPSGRVATQRVTLGLGPLGNLYKVVSDADAQAVLAAWWDLGMRTFDVAPLYGHGIAEMRLGHFLATRGSSGVVVSTKAGRSLQRGAPPDPDELIEGEPLFQSTPPGVNPVFDFRARALGDSVRASLERLHMERLDIVYLHDPDLYLATALDEGIAALLDLRREGLVGAIGVGTTSLVAAVAFARDAPIDCLMLAGRYTLLEQGALDELLPLCVERGIGVVNAGVLNSGFLADPRIGARYEYRPSADQEQVQRAQAIRRVCERHGVALLAAAIQFSATHPAITSVAVGAGTVAHARLAFEMYQTPIPPDVWDELKAERLIRVDTPVGLRSPEPTPQG